MYGNGRLVVIPFCHTMTPGYTALTSYSLVYVPVTARKYLQIPYRVSHAELFYCPPFALVYRILKMKHHSQYNFVTRYFIHV